MNTTDREYDSADPSARQKGNLIFQNLISSHLGKDTEQKASERNFPREASAGEQKDKGA